MTAAALLRTLRCDGFDVVASVDGGLLVRPASALNDDTRQAIREHRAALLVLVRRDDGDDRRLCIDCQAFDGRFCTRPRLSQLVEPGEVARILQRCPGFLPRSRN
jgi:hypothetical protein